MLKDQFGNSLTTTSEAARDAYVKGVDLYLAADAGVEQAFAAIATEDWSNATELLTRVMSDHERIGGSRAQRDLIEYALAQTLLKQGNTGEAKRLLEMRRPLATNLIALSGVVNAI